MNQWLRSPLAVAVSGFPSHGIAHQSTKVNEQVTTQTPPTIKLADQPARLRVRFHRHPQFNGCLLLLVAIMNHRSLPLASSTAALMSPPSSSTPLLGTPLVSTHFFSHQPLSPHTQHNGDEPSSNVYNSVNDVYSPRLQQWATPRSLSPELVPPTSRGVRSLAGPAASSATREQSNTDDWETHPPPPIRPLDGTGLAQEPALPYHAYPFVVRCPTGWNPVGPHCTTVLVVPPYTECPGDAAQFTRGLRASMQPSHLSPGICEVSDETGVKLTCQEGFNLELRDTPPDLSAPRDMSFISDASVNMEVTENPVEKIKEAQEDAAEPVATRKVPFELQRSDPTPGQLEFLKNLQGGGRRRGDDNSATSSTGSAVHGQLERRLADRPDTASLWLTVVEKNDQRMAISKTENNAAAWAYTAKPRQLQARRQGRRKLPRRQKKDVDAHEEKPHLFVCKGEDVIPYHEMRFGERCPLGYTPDMDGCHAHQAFPPRVECPSGFASSTAPLNEYAFRDKVVVKCSKVGYYKARVWCPRGFVPINVPRPDLAFGKQMQDGDEATNPEQSGHEPTAAMRRALRAQRVSGEAFTERRGHEQSIQEVGDDATQKSAAVNRRWSRHQDPTATSQSPSTADTRVALSFSCAKQTGRASPHGSLKNPAADGDVCEALEEEWEKTLDAQENQATEGGGSLWGEWQEDTVMAETRRTSKVADNRQQMQQAANAKLLDSTALSSPDRGAEGVIIRVTEEMLTDAVLSNAQALVHSEKARDTEHGEVKKNASSGEEEEEASDGVGKEDSYLSYSRPSGSVLNFSMEGPSVGRELRERQLGESSSLEKEAHPRGLQENHGHPTATACVQSVAVFSANCSEYQCNTPYMREVERTIRNWIYYRLQGDPDEADEIIPTGKWREKEVAASRH